jgi:hypothetical protein
VIDAINAQDDKVFRDDRQRAIGAQLISAVDEAAADASPRVVQ